MWNLPGGPVGKNPPVNAGNTGSIPDPGRFYMPRGNSACEPRLPSPRSRALELKLLSLHTYSLWSRNKSSLCDEKPKHHHWRASPAHHNHGKPVRSIRD